jgi:hypothetical protein
MNRQGAKNAKKRREKREDQMREREEEIERQLLFLFSFPLFLTLALLVSWRFFCSCFLDSIWRLSVKMGNSAAEHP